MKKSHLLYRILMFILAIILAGVGWYLSQSGFNSIQTLRQIERISGTTVSAALPGEVKLNAQVRKSKKLLKSEYFKIDSVYYLYRYEIEKTDSDGDKYWSTEFERSNSVDFTAQDSTGSININLESQSDSNLTFSVPISEQVVIGSSRHTEWRIEPYDQIFILGALEQGEIGFIQQGQYLPIISKYGEQHEKSNIGIKLVLLIAGGISLIAFAAFSLASGLQIHRTIVFLLMLSFSTIIPLVHLGINMLHLDIFSGEQRTTNQTQKTLTAINQTLEGYASQNLSWQDLAVTLKQIESDLPSELQNKIDELQINAVYTQQKYQHQLESFPSNLMTWLYSVKVINTKQFLSEKQLLQLDKHLNEFKKAETLGLTPIFISVAGFIFCIIFTWFGFKLIRLKRHIENIPTSKSTGLVFGLSEIKGRIRKIENRPPLEGPLTKSSCYWYHYIVQESRGSGKEQKWVTIEDRQSHQEFNCKDAYGEIRVNPKNAEIVSHHSKTRRSGKLRYTEKTLKLNDKVYVLGHAKIDRSIGDKLEIRSSIDPVTKKKDMPFLITNLTEHAIMMKKANNGMLSLTVAFSALVFACLFYLGIQGSFSPLDYLLAALIAPSYMSLVILVLHYNDLIFLKQRADRNLANIYVSMQKRHHLIPNIEKIVKKYLEHESSLLKKITDLRTQYKVKEEQSLEKIGSQLEKEQSILSSIIAKAEGNPDLKAVELNKKLMNKLIDLENEISLMREGYNDAVSYYNTRIGIIPDVLFARSFGFKPMALFNFEERKFAKIDVDWS